MEDKKAKKPIKKEVDPMVAKRDFVIAHNDYLRTILKGDDLSDVPEMFHANLKTEAVI